MRLKTYEKQLFDAITSDMTLQRRLTNHLIAAMIDTYEAWERGLTIAQVVSVLRRELAQDDCNYDTIQAALYEVKPRGKAQEETKHDH